jgi:hypothetical protein
MHQSNKKIFVAAAFFVILVLAYALGNSALAQNSENKVALTITPPLVKFNMSSSETWKGNVKLINNSSTEVNVFPQVVDFKSDAEGGVELIFSNTNGSEEDIKSTKRFALSQWVDIAPGPYKISGNNSIEIPYTIKLPDDAEPGGHYAAIIIGTKPNENLKGSGLKISSMVASLVLLDVNGDVTESGRIRQFSTDKSIFDRPDVNFNLRFENTGNIHLQPKGEIKIFNLFGQEKGKIGINQNNSFGHVLPLSTRKWNFNWTDDNKLSNMGRYKASLILSFGEKSKEAVAQDLYFWVIDFKIISLILASIIGLILIIVVLLKLYVRKTVKDAQRQMGLMKPLPHDIAPVQHQPTEIAKESGRQLPNKPINAVNPNKTIDLKSLMSNKEKDKS